MFKIYLILLLFFPLISLSQSGGIRGIVTDQDFEVPIENVRITISETGDELRTQSGGSFYKDGLMPGSYTLIFSANGYSRLTRPQVIVMGSALTDVNIELAGEYEEMDELVVRDIQLGGASEIGLLNLRMENSALMDSVGADLISRAGASDAAGALKLVSGTTVQDGKYAVVRGLPDRYVVSLLNGVRLPTSDPDKRAVQLDQYPSSLIESVQVVKSFTPDQQGDASGGAVDIVLRGIPEERILKFSVGTKWNDRDASDDFLYAESRKHSFLGERDFNAPADDDPRYASTTGAPIPGSYSSSLKEQPMNYSFGLEVGDRFSVPFLGDELAIGMILSLNYDSSASHVANMVSDKYITPALDVIQESEVNPDMNALTADELMPAFTGSFANNGIRTDLWDVNKSKEEVSWNGAVGFGVEHDLFSSSYMHIFTHNAEDNAIAATDTRGRQYFVVPEYVNTNETSTTDTRDIAPFRKLDTLLYRERETVMNQWKGNLKIPIDEINVNDFIRFGSPEVDWSLSKSSSSLSEPDKRILANHWIPGGAVTAPYASYNDEDGPFSLLDFSTWYDPANAWLSDFETPSGEILPVPDGGWYQSLLNSEGERPSSVVSNSPSYYYGTESGEQLGNFQQVWKRVVEDSDQFSFNYNLPLMNWTDEEGSLTLGIFQDSVERSFYQQTLNNKSVDSGGVGLPTFEGEWDDNAADLFGAGTRNYLGDPNYPNTHVFVSQTDTSYQGNQEIDAWYYSLEYPLLNAVLLRGGARYEKFKLQTLLDPDSLDQSFAYFNDLKFLVDLDRDNADVERSSILPSFGFDLNPVDRLTFRFNYAETVANQQFKEVVPILQRDYPGAPAFAGNPQLRHSELENIDYRIDYVPYEGGLISASFFSKEIVDPIEYYQSSDSLGNSITFVTNFPSATAEGWEVEVRQDLGKFSSALQGFKIGGNYTLIEGELNISNTAKRDIMAMPEYLYNVFLTYDASWRNLKVGLFFTEQGETLKTNKPEEGKVPAIYALPYDNFNISLSANIIDRMKITFKAKNLLNPDIESVYRENGYMDKIHTSYSKGRSYSLGISYSF
ncbi:MAG: TonB-dependent receptor domain-containing protein [Pontiellaceae bacterium]